MLPDPSGLVVIPEAHSRNLSELHGADGSYSYSGILLGDLGYLVEELRGADRAELFNPASIPSPSSETLENLHQLLSADSSDPAARAQQLRWCVRLVQSDASDLVRELSAEGIADIGLGLGLTELKEIAAPEAVIGPNEIAEIFEVLLKEIRLGSETGDETSEFRSTCKRAGTLPLDIDGAWRLHALVSELQGLEMGPAAKATLYALSRDLEETLISVGLYAAITDRAERVALVGLEGYVQIVGPMALMPYLTTPDALLSELLLTGILKLIRDYGLPEAGLSTKDLTACYGTLLAWALDHPSSSVRVQAMLALKRLDPSGPLSLREEDWAQWRAPVTADIPETP